MLKPDSDGRVSAQARWAPRQLSLRVRVLPHGGGMNHEHVFCEEWLRWWMTAVLMCLISALTAAASWSSASSSASQCSGNSSSRTTCLRSASREYTLFNTTGFMDMLNRLHCHGLGCICFIAVNWRSWSDTLNPRDALSRKRNMRRSYSVTRRIISWSPLLASRPSTWRWVSVCAETQPSDQTNSSSLLFFMCISLGQNGAALFSILIKS